MKLSHAILGISEPVSKLAESMNITHAAYLPPWQNYISGRDRHFDERKAEARLPAMREITGGNRRIMLDMEWPGTVLRGFTDTLDEDDEWRLNELGRMTKWFRAKFPNHQLGNYNCPATTGEGGGFRAFPHIYDLTKRLFDFSAISLYFATRWNRDAAPHEVETAKKLKGESGHPIVAFVWKRRELEKHDGYKLLGVLPPDLMYEMLKLAIHNCDEVVIWSNDVAQMANPNRELKDVYDQCDIDATDIEILSMAFAIQQEVVVEVGN